MRPVGPPSSDASVSGSAVNTSELLRTSDPGHRNAYTGPGDSEGTARSPRRLRPTTTAALRSALALSQPVRLTTSRVSVVAIMQPMLSRISRPRIG
jgi:hypothetical protein